MNNYISKQAATEALTDMSNKLGVSVEALKRAVYEIHQEECDIEDIEWWLENEGYSFDDADVSCILRCLTEGRDANYGTWDNISAAYARSGLKLREETS